MKPPLCQPIPPLDTSFFQYETLQSPNIAKRLRETVPAGRGKLLRVIRVPILHNFAHLNTYIYSAMFGHGTCNML